MINLCLIFLIFINKKDFLSSLPIVTYTMGINLVNISYWNKNKVEITVEKIYICVAWKAFDWTVWQDHLHSEVGSTNLF